MANIISNYLNNNSIYSTFTSSAKQADSVSKVTPVKKVAPVDSNAAAIYVKSAEEPERKIEQLS